MSTRNVRLENAGPPNNTRNHLESAHHTVDADNTDDPASEESRDDEDSEKESYSPSEAAFDTQPTVFSEESDHRRSQHNCAEGLSPHKNVSEVPAPDRPTATVQKLVIPVPTIGEDDISHNDVKSATGKIVTDHHLNRPDRPCILGKRRRHSPTPTPGEQAGPRPRKLVILSDNESKAARCPLSGAAEVSDCHIKEISALDSQHKSNTQRLLQLGIPSASVVLSPSQSNISTRHQSISPAQIPTLATPHDRDGRIHHTLSPQLLSPEATSKPFNIFTALVSHPELTLEFSKHLEVENLINLYAISKDFHALVDNRFTTFIMAQAIGKASESAQTFPFRAYRNLCKRDPAGRIMLFNVSEKEKGLERVATARDNDVRFVPSFRWLKMILHHEAVVDRILRCLAMEGHRFPKRTTLTVKKLWFTLDITDNGRRIGLLHDTRFWSHKDLFLATMFFVKLDMRLTDPVSGDGETGLRKLLLAQKSLETLARVLAREELTSQLEMLRMVIRFDYTPSRPLQDGETVFGIPAKEVGKLCYEGRGRGESGNKLVPIDELVGREAVRRRLNLQYHYLDMMLYGYINKTMFEDVRTPMNLLARDSSAAAVIGDGGGSRALSEELEAEVSSDDDDDGQETSESERKETMGLFDEGETDENAVDTQV